MLKAYKYRLYPSDEQRIQIAKTFGCCRFVYNQTLAYRKDIYEQEKKVRLHRRFDGNVAAIQKKQQAQAEQETAKVEAETAKIQAQKEADVKKIQAQGEADANKIEAQGEAEANKTLSGSITQNLIDMKLAEARQQHGWVTVNGANTVVTSEEEK